MGNIVEDFGLESGAGLEKWEAQIKEKCGLQKTEMVTAISEWIKNNSEELSLEFVNIAPYKNYEKLLENNDDMAKFLKNEASKIENWELKQAKPCENPNLIQFMFDCSAIDEGDTFKGFVVINKSGKIRHAFAKNQE